MCYPHPQPSPQAISIHPHKCLPIFLLLPQAPVLTADTNPVITGMAAAALVRMHDRGICQHFHSNSCNGYPHYHIFHFHYLGFPAHGITVVPIIMQVSNNEQLLIDDDANMIMT